MRRSTVLLSLLALAPAAAQVRPADPAVIAEVQSGKRTEAKAAWWGFDPADSTQALQAAIRSGARKVVVENLGRPWIIDRIELASDQEVVFEPGVVVQAKRGAFRGVRDSLFTATDCSNLKLTGPGATFAMWKEDYTQPGYAKAEWRHTIALLSCKNVQISGLTLANSGGDGIYLGVRRRGETNQRIQIRDVTMERHHRQGISVISAEDLLVERCAFIETGGTPPQAGIDFEPNSPEDRLVRCVLRDCRAENNRGLGYVFALQQLRRQSQPISIRLERCTTLGDPYSVSIGTGNAPEDAVTGTLEFVDCRFEAAQRQPVLIRRNPLSGLKVTFARCSIVNPAATDPAVTPIAFISSPEDTEDLGGVVFTECKIIDPVDRRPLSFVDPTGELRLLDVTGKLTITKGDKSTVLELTPGLLNSWFPAPDIRKFPRVATDLAALTRVAPEAPAKEGSVRARVRQAADWLVWAEANTDVSVTLGIEAVRKGDARTVPLKVYSPAGVRVTATMKNAEAERLITFRSKQAGAYRISAQPGSFAAELRSASGPACLFAENAAIHLFATSRPLHFWVPAGVSVFGVKVSGAGRGERVKARLLDPSGQVRQEQDQIERGTQLLVELAAPSKGEIWTLELTKPSQGPLEDYSLKLQGIPTIVSTSPGALLRPGK